jgi:hypothetical protein
VTFGLGNGQNAGQEATFTEFAGHNEEAVPGADCTGVACSPNDLPNATAPEKPATLGSIFKERLASLLPAPAVDAPAVDVPQDAPAADPAGDSLQRVLTQALLDALGQNDIPLASLIAERLREYRKI